MRVIWCGRASGTGILLLDVELFIHFRFQYIEEFFPPKDGNVFVEGILHLSPQCEDVGLDLSRRDDGIGWTAGTSTADAIVNVIEEKFELCFR